MMIRVLHSVSYMHRAGVETFLMNYYRHIDRVLVQFDFLCNKHKIGDYDEEIRQLGGRIFYRSENDNMEETDYSEFWKCFLEEHPEIRIVHTHNGAKQQFPLDGAYRAEIPVRIAHAHSTDFVHDEKYLRRLDLIRGIPLVASDYFACSNEAGAFFFGDKLWREKGVIIHNAIPCDKFVYNKAQRQQLRSRLGIENCFVIGHVGRFMEQKNHSRLIEIFHYIYSRQPKARLLLIGSGELEDSLRQHAAALGVLHAVIFAGEQSEMHLWYQVMDVFVMPSLFEGLTLAGIEAQAAGLPCVFSDRVSRETQVTSDISFVPVEAEDTIWYGNIMKYVNHVRIDTSKQIRQAGYDICQEAKKLQEIYCQLVAVQEKK